MARLRIAGIDVAKLVNKEVGGQLKNAEIVLIKTTEGARATSTSGRTITRTSFRGTGLVSDYDEHTINGTLVKAGDREITIFGDSLNGIIPKKGDEITAEGSTYTIVRVGRDPAAATYTCQVR